MNILITNDDGYTSKGIQVLAEIMSEFGNVTVIAPKKHQSGMSMAVSLGFKPVAYKELPDMKPGTWSYLDATPASCVKYGLNFQFLEQKPDVVVSGINHGSNAATAACYSGTLGAAEEGALNGVLSIAVSLDNLDSEADFTAVKDHFPEIFRRILKIADGRYGVFYNVNFPNIPSSDIKGVKVAHQGRGRWVREFREWDPERYAHLGLTPEKLGQKSTVTAEAGEKIYMMVGDFLDDQINDERADHHLMEQGYIALTPVTLDKTDVAEKERLIDLNMDYNL